MADPMQYNCAILAGGKTGNLLFDQLAIEIRREITVVVRRVFISHGSKEKDEWDFVKDLHNRVRSASTGDGAKFSALLDYDDLKPGDDWRPELYSWMLLCDLAIIVISRSVPKESRWVPRESLILRWRHELDRKFKPLVVLTDGLTKETLKRTPFDEIGMEDLQYIEIAQKRNGAQRVVDEITRLASAMPRHDTVAMRIEEVLKAERVHESRIEDASNRMDLDLNEWAATFDAERQLAIRMAHFGFARHGETSPGIDAASALAGGLSDERRNKLFTVMRPLWVDRCAAANLHRCATMPNNQNVIVLSCRKGVTLQHYVERAWSLKWDSTPEVRKLPEVVRHVDTVLGTGTLSPRTMELMETVYEECRDLLEDELRQLPLSGEAKASIESTLRALSAAGAPVIFAISARACTLADVVDLKRAMPLIVFIFLGTEAPDLASAVAVSPELSDRNEELALQEMRVAKTRMGIKE